MSGMIIAVIDLGCCRAIPIIELGKTWIEGERKARLLPCPLHAAAPALLEALIATTEHCDKNHKPPIPLALMNQVRQAISHAEGQK